jgi:hypothetical protein
MHPVRIRSRDVHSPYRPAGPCAGRSDATAPPDTDKDAAVRRELTNLVPEQCALNDGYERFEFLVEAQAKFLALQA